MSPFSHLRQRPVPVLLQANGAECGLVSLAMVMAHLGLEADLPALRERYEISARGSTLADLAVIASDLGFEATAYRTELEILPRLPRPLVLHWNLNHFVVLVGVRSGRAGREYLIHDPATGRQTLTEAELSRSFTGVVLPISVVSPKTLQLRSRRLTLPDLWRSTSGLTPALAQSIGLSVLLQLAALALPLLLRLMLDDVVRDRSADLFGTLAVGLAGLAIVTISSTYVRGRVLVFLSNSFGFQVQLRVVRHLLGTPLKWFEGRHVADIASRLEAGSEIASNVDQAVLGALIDGLMAIATACLMIYIAWFAAVPLLVAVLAYGVFRFFATKALNRAETRLVMARARETTAIIELLAGMASIRAFGKERQWFSAWRVFRTESLGAKIERQNIEAEGVTAATALAQVEQLAFLLIVAFAVLKGELSVGAVFALLLYKQQCLRASFAVVDVAAKLRQLDVPLTRLSDIILAKTEPRILLAAEPTQPETGAIELRNLRYRHALGSPEILTGINLHIARGSSVAIVGPTGAGKSTLLKLIVGLLEPTSGAVLIDGRPVVTATPETWERQFVGYVAQDDTLYSGTIAENIAFFSETLDMTRAVTAASIAHIHADISNMPMGYETLVGNMGSNLSGGQRARLLLARALYARPTILCVDEGTAHLDVSTEQDILNALSNFEMTRIFVTHRPSSLVKADLILELRDGQLTPVRDAVSESNAVLATVG